MNGNFKRYIIFWLSQAVSQLGSSMTSFALILWAYTQKGSAMTVPWMSFYHRVYERLSRTCIIICIWRAYADSDN